MNERIRLHLDENVDPAVALGLRRYGIDVTITFEVGLQGKSDQAQLEFVRKTQRVIFTQDTDFLIIANADNNHPGIAFCKKGTRSIGENIDSLRLIYEVLTPEEMIGHVEFL